MESYENRVMLSYPVIPTGKTCTISASLVQSECSNLYKCKQCNMTFTLSSQLKIHELSHSVERPFTCEQCNKTFIKAAHLKTHVRNVHNTERPNQCHQCCERFNRRTDCRVHEIIHMGDACLSCPHCPGKFRRPLALEKHIRKCHDSVFTGCDILAGLCSTKVVVNDISNESPDEISILESNETRRVTVESQVDSASSPKNASSLKRHVCTVCGLGFKQRLHLRTHERIHTGERPHMCQTCGKNYKRPEALAHHEKTHTSEKLACKYCDKVFNYKSSLMGHLKIHYGVRRHSCSTCGASFFRPCELRLHEGIHSGVKPFQCKCCGDRFLRPGDLRIHERKHTGERPYICHFCGKGFIKSGDLVRHERIHSGEKPYMCPYCYSKFKQANNLKGHIKKKHPDGNYSPPRRQHTERVYQCEDCNVWFSQASEFEQHSVIHELQKSSASVTTPDNISITGKQVDAMENVVNSTNVDSHKVSIVANVDKHHSSLSKLHVTYPTVKTMKTSMNSASNRRVLPQHRVDSVGRRAVVTPYNPNTKLTDADSSKNLTRDTDHERDSANRNTGLLGQQQWICPVCNSGFPNLTMLSSHLEIHGITNMVVLVPHTS